MAVALALSSKVAAEPKIDVAFVKRRRMYAAARTSGRKYLINLGGNLW